LSQPNKHVLLARQSIYNIDKTVFGYELLFRNDADLSAIDVGEDNATSEVLVNYCTSISNEINSEHKPIFINVSESFLLSEAFLPIDQRFVVIELLERIKVTKELVKAVAAWKKHGFRFALDDFDFTPQWDPIIPYVDFIKADVLTNSMDWTEKHKKTLDKRNITWLAEKIENLEILSACENLGFTLFQGYYLAKPKTILGSSIRPSSAVTMQVIKKANQKDTTIDDLTNLVTQDPKLSLLLIKLINSSIFTLPRPINELKEAIVFLGIDTLKKWAMLIAYISDSPAPIETCKIVLSRAKACELVVALKYDTALSESAFLAGLISGVDLLLELKTEYFLKEINLNEPIRRAILKLEGEIGETLKSVKQLEFYLGQEPEKIHTLEIDLIQQYSLAQEWSSDILKTLEKS